MNKRRKKDCNVEEEVFIFDSIEGKEKEEEEEKEEKEEEGEKEEGKE